MGIAYYIQNHFDLHDCVFSGASGGAWVSLLLATGSDIREVLDTMISIGQKWSAGRTLGLYLMYDRAVRECVDVLFKDKDLPAILNGRMIHESLSTKIELLPACRTVVDRPVATDCSGRGDV
jgi:hypothetical protein